jgi:hypothetical protein
MIPIHQYNRGCQTIYTSSRSDILIDSNRVLIEKYSLIFISIILNLYIYVKLELSDSDK